MAFVKSTILAFPLGASSPMPSNFGEELQEALQALITQEEELRPSLAEGSWEAAYHTGIRIELAGAAFHVLTSLPLKEPPVSFLAATKSRLLEHQEKLRSAASEPYTGLQHGHFDGISAVLGVLDRFLEMRLDSPTP